MKNAAKWMMIIGGTILLLGAGSGILATTLSMTHVFATLGATGITDPKTLATSIGHALFYSTIGFAIASIGLVSLITGFVVFLLSKRDSTPPQIPTNKAEQGA